MTYLSERLATLKPFRFKSNDEYETFLAIQKKIGVDQFTAESFQKEYESKLPGITKKLSQDTYSNIHHFLTIVKDLQQWYAGVKNSFHQFKEEQKSKPQTRESQRRDDQWFDKHFEFVLMNYLNRDDIQVRSEAIIQFITFFKLSDDAVLKSAEQDTRIENILIIICGPKQGKELLKLFFKIKSGLGGATGETYIPKYHDDPFMQGLVTTIIDNEKKETQKLKSEQVSHTHEVRFEEQSFEEQELKSELPELEELREMTFGYLVNSISMFKATLGEQLFNQFLKENSEFDPLLLLETIKKQKLPALNAIVKETPDLVNNLQNFMNIKKAHSILMRINLTNMKYFMIPENQLKPYQKRRLDLTKIIPESDIHLLVAPSTVGYVLTTDRGNNIAKNTFASVALNAIRRQEKKLTKEEFKVLFQQTLLLYLKNRQKMIEQLTHARNTAPNPFSDALLARAEVESKAIAKLDKTGSILNLDEKIRALKNRLNDAGKALQDVATFGVGLDPHETLEQQLTRAKNAVTEATIYLEDKKYEKNSPAYQRIQQSYDKAKNQVTYLLALQHLKAVKAEVEGELSSLQLQMEQAQHELVSTFTDDDLDQLYANYANENVLTSQQAAANTMLVSQMSDVMNGYANPLDKILDKLINLPKLILSLDSQLNDQMLHTASAIINKMPPTSNFSDFYARFMAYQPDKQLFTEERIRTIFNYVQKVHAINVNLLDWYNSAMKLLWSTSKSDLTASSAIPLLEHLFSNNPDKLEVLKKAIDTKLMPFKFSQYTETAPLDIMVNWISSAHEAKKISKPFEYSDTTVAFLQKYRQEFPHLMAESHKISMIGLALGELKEHCDDTAAALKSQYKPSPKLFSPQETDQLNDLIQTIERLSKLLAFTAAPKVTQLSGHLKKFITEFEAELPKLTQASKLFPNSFIEDTKALLRQSGAYVEKQAKVEAAKAFESRAKK